MISPSHVFTPSNAQHQPGHRMLHHIYLYQIPTASVKGNVCGKAGPDLKTVTVETLPSSEKAKTERPATGQGSNPGQIGPKR